MSNKDIALKCNVSPSYVSKIKTGKKIPYIYFKNPTLIKDEFFEVYGTELDQLLLQLDNTKLLVSEQEIVEYLTVQMKKALIRAKMYQTILRRIK